MKYELRSDGERSAIFPEDHESEANTFPIALGMLERRIDFWQFLGEVEANNWLEAKILFGESLTPLQERMVKGLASIYEVSGRTYGFDLVQLPRDPRGRKTRSSGDVGAALAQAWKEAGMT